MSGDSSGRAKGQIDKAKIDDVFRQGNSWRTGPGRWRDQACVEHGEGAVLIET